MPSSSIQRQALRPPAAPRDASRLPLLAAAAVAALFFALVTQLPRDGAPLPLDAAAAAFSAPWHTGAPATLLAWITVAGSGNCVVAAGALASAWLLALRKLRLVAVLWWTLAGAAACTWVAKMVVARPRPELLPGFAAWSPSFPSSHASAAMAYVFIAYALLRDVRHRGTQALAGLAAALLVGLVAASRIVLGMHHATDVLGGLLLAAAWVFLGIAVAERQRHDRRALALQAAFA